MGKERPHFFYKTCLAGIGIAGFIYIVHLLSPSPRYVGLEQQVFSKEESSAPSQVLDIEYIEENLHSLDQKNPQLIQYARADMLKSQANI